MRSLARAAACGGEQIWGHVLEKHAGQPWQSRWPAPLPSRIGRLQSRFGPPVRVRATIHSNRHAQRAALPRRSLPTDTLSTFVLKLCPQAKISVRRARAPTASWRSSSTTSRRRARRAALQHRPDLQRCAAVAARVRDCLRTAERVLLRASQDRCRDVLRVWP